MVRDGYEPVLTKSRWCLLKRPENLTAPRKLKLKDPVRYNLQSVHAYLLKMVSPGDALQDRTNEPKSGSSTTAARAKWLKGFRISTASQFTLRVITDSVTTACGLTTYLILGGAKCRI